MATVKSNISVKGLLSSTKNDILLKTGSYIKRILQSRDTFKKRKKFTQANFSSEQAKFYNIKRRVQKYANAKPINIQNRFQLNSRPGESPFLSLKSNVKLNRAQFEVKNDSLSVGLKQYSGSKDVGAILEESGTTTKKSFSTLADAFSLKTQSGRYGQTFLGKNNNIIFVDENGNKTGTKRVPVSKLNKKSQKSINVQRRPYLEKVYDKFIKTGVIKSIIENSISKLFK